MSGHYSCGQFNDAFQARRLKNWQYGVNNPGKFSTRRPCQGTTEFIADCNGHLLPHVPRNACSSPWGDYRTCIWEETSKCDCTDRVRNPQDYEPKLPKFFKKQPTPPKPPVKRPCGVKPVIDPILNQLRESRIPIIWMIGLPTERIQHLREKFCEELAGALNYAYINLDNCIEAWRDRYIKIRQQQELGDNENQENIMPHMKVPGQGLRHIQQQKQHSLKQQQKQQQLEAGAIDWNNITIPAKLSRSLTELVMEYDKTPDRTVLAYSSHINTHRQGRSRQSKQSSSKLCIQNAPHYDPITGDEIRVQQPGNMIQFTMGQRFTRDKTMELLKFAMIESLPTKGYIIDGVFLDQGDGICFEKMFYGPAVCTYFTESIINNSIDEWNRVRSRPPAQDLIIDKQIKTNVQLISPKHMRRNKKYSFLEVDKLCRLFETKMIRVLNAEEANQETIHFVYSLVYKHIKNYPSHGASSQGNYLERSNAGQGDGVDNGEAEEEDDSDAFLSPINTAILVPQDRDDVPGDYYEDEQLALPHPTTLDPIEQEFQKMLSKQLPVIWILGLKQLSTEPIRQTFCQLLADQMNFTYINMDAMILNWYEFEAKAEDDEADDDVEMDQDQDKDNQNNMEGARGDCPEEFRPTPGQTPRVVRGVHRTILEQAHKLVKRIVDNNDLLLQDEILELVKYALMLAPPDTNGYIIDEFPVNVSEGETFEKEVYPATSLVYFLNFTWTVNKSNEPPVEIPQYFRRTEPYSEDQVEKVCDLYGYKAVKVWNAEDLDEEGMTAINNIISECIAASNKLDKQQQLEIDISNLGGGEAPEELETSELNDRQSTPRTVDPHNKRRTQQQPKMTCTKIRAKQQDTPRSKANMQILNILPSADPGSGDGIISARPGPPAPFRKVQQIEQEREQKMKKKSSIPKKISAKSSSTKDVKLSPGSKEQVEQGQGQPLDTVQPSLPKSPVITSNYTKRVQELCSINPDLNDAVFDEIEVEYDVDVVDDEEINNQVEIESLPKTPESDTNNVGEDQSSRQLRELEEQVKQQKYQQHNNLTTFKNNQMTALNSSKNRSRYNYSNILINKSSSSRSCRGKLQLPGNGAGEVITQQKSWPQILQQHTAGNGDGDGDTDDEVNIEICEDDDDDCNFNDEVIDATEDYNDDPDDEDVEEVLYLANHNKSKTNAKFADTQYYAAGKQSPQNLNEHQQMRGQKNQVSSKPNQRYVRPENSCSSHNYRRSGGGDF